MYHCVTLATHVFTLLFTTKKIFMATKKSKGSLYLYLLLIVAGCVLAFSSIITNDYLKLVVVMITLLGGLFGIMKSLSNPKASVEESNVEDK